jgi:Kef-type K+ transport system membrane component KefB
MPSPAFLIPLAVSGLLGAIGGSAFRWAAPEHAWNIFTAAFLWTLISAAGTTIGRFAGERLRRSQWRRALWLAHLQSFPLTTVFLLVAALFSARAALVPSLLPVLYSATLTVALALATLGVFTSPYVK